MSSASVLSFFLNTSNDLISCNRGLNSFHSLGNLWAGNKEVNVVLYLLQCDNCWACCLVGGLSSIVKYM